MPIEDRHVPTADLAGGRAVTPSTVERPRQPQLNGLVAAFVAPALCLSDEDGQIRPGGAGGVFVEDRRLLSELVLVVDGVEPSPLSRELGGGAENRFEAACFNLGTAVPDPTVLVTRRRRVHSDGLVERCNFRSYDRAALRFVVELRLSADFAEMAEVKSGALPEALLAASDGGALRWSDEEGGSVVASASPVPEVIEADGGRMAWVVDLEPGSEVTVSLTVRRTGTAAGAAVVRPVVASPGAPARFASGDGAALVVGAGDLRLGRLLGRSLADLEALQLVTVDRPDDVFLAAGVPWFLTLFGRDSIWAARMLLPIGADLALGTLRTLAHRQGRHSDPLTGEAPGKILHELRRSPTHHERWRRDGRPLSLPSAYYGTVDATLLWVCLLHDAWRFGADEAEVERLLDPMLGCLGWLSSSLGGRDGFVSYVDESGSGLENQGWKDSHDGIQFRDGRIARAPLALCEVQAYAYEAAVGGAALLDAFGRPGSSRLLEVADGLAARFRRRFWVEDADGPYPAVALDAAGAAVDSLASNIGHLLGTGLLDGAEEDLVARRLASAELDSGFGVRTLATSSAGFNPLSYHAGSVWAHDTAIALTGLTRAAGDAGRPAAASLIEGLLSAAERFEHRMPELYAGHQRGERHAPDPYPASCRPQAWSMAASVVIVSCLLGLWADVPHGKLHVAPLESAVGLRSVDGVRIGTRVVSLRLGERGAVEAHGLPPGLDLVVGAASRPARRSSE